MGSYFVCLGKYATFSGRATRTEFFGYSVVNAILTGVLAYLYLKAQTPLSQGFATGALFIYLLIIICPTLAVTSRRWHDIGRTGKWLWLYLVPVIGVIVTLGFMLTKGEESSNEYGRNPRERRYRRRARKQNSRY